MTVSRSFQYAVFCILFAFSSVQSAHSEYDHSPYSENNSNFKIQTWSLYGYTEFSTISNATYGNGNFKNWSLANQVELEFIPGQKSIHPSILSDLRFSVDYEWINFGTVSTYTLIQAKLAAAVSWWVFGTPKLYKVVNGLNMPVRKYEFKLFAGISLQRFSELQTDFLSEQIVGLTNPVLIGAQFGFRYCIPIGDRSCLDISERTIFPLRLNNTPGRVNFIGSMSYNGSIIFDHTFLTYFSGGIGLTGSLSQLSYVNASGFTQKNHVLIIAPTLSFQLRL